MPEGVRSAGSLAWLSLSLAVVVLDQATKLIAEHLLTAHQPVAVLPSLNLFLTYNTGAAFSFLREAGGWQRWLFALLSTGVSIFIVVMAGNSNGRIIVVDCFNADFRNAIAVGN